MYHTHISARRRLLDLQLKEVWRYRDLILLFTRRTFSVSYKQTILGPLWLFINPLLTALIYVVLFGRIAELSTDGAPQLLYLAGTALWAFSPPASAGARLPLRPMRRFFEKVYFPRLVVPISNMLCAAISSASSSCWYVRRWRTIPCKEPSPRISCCGRCCRCCWRWWALWVWAWACLSRRLQRNTEISPCWWALACSCGCTRRRWYILPAPCRTAWHLSCGGTLRRHPWSCFGISCWARGRRNGDRCCCVPCLPRCAGHTVSCGVQPGGAQLHR